MLNRAKRSIDVTIGGYTFIIRGRQIIVATKQKAEEELRIITELYKCWKSENHWTGRPLNGEFRLCLNPDCNNAFYALRFKIKMSCALCCCQRCAGIVFGSEKGEQVGRSKQKLSQWFFELPGFKAANWLVETARLRNQNSVRVLNILVQCLPERMREIRRGIRVYPVAERIVREFEATKEGERLRTLFERSPA